MCGPANSISQLVDCVFENNLEVEHNLKIGEDLANAMGENSKLIQRREKVEGTGPAPPGQILSSSSAMPSSHWTLMIVFFSLLIDLLGFTVILPLIPSMLEHYSKNDQVFLKSSMQNIKLKN